MKSENNRNRRIGAVVLAAGKSSRMGELKQLALVGRMAALERVLGMLRVAHIDCTIVVLGFEAERIKKEVDLNDVVVVQNSDYERGMSSSIQLGLAGLPSAIDAAFMVLADQPLVRASTLEKLISEYNIFPASALVPTYNNVSGNPVLIDREMFPSAMQLTRDQGFRVVLQKISTVRRVEVDDPGVLVDFDTPEDLRRCNDLICESNL